jgi:hypothetical protein
VGCPQAPRAGSSTEATGHDHRGSPTAIGTVHDTVCGLVPGVCRIRDEDPGGRVGRWAGAGNPEPAHRRPGPGLRSWSEGGLPWTVLITRPRPSPRRQQSRQRSRQPDRTLLQRVVSVGEASAVTAVERPFPDQARIRARPVQPARTGADAWTRTLSGSSAVAGGRASGPGRTKAVTVTRFAACVHGNFPIVDMRRARDLRTRRGYHPAGGGRRSRRRSPEGDPMRIPWSVAVIHGISVGTRQPALTTRRLCGIARPSNGCGPRRPVPVWAGVSRPSASCSVRMGFRWVAARTGRGRGARPRATHDP